MVYCRCQTVINNMLCTPLTWSIHSLPTMILWMVVTALHQV